VNVLAARKSDSQLRSSAMRAAAALVAIIASFLTVYALCRSFDAQAGPAILAAILAIAQSRRAHPLGWSRALTAPLIMAGTALAATGAALLLHVNPWLGASVFTAALFASVWLRNFGERAKAAGAAIALPFVALLVVPARADAPGGPLVDLLLVIAAGIVSLAYSTLVALAMRRFGITPAAETRAGTTSSERAKRPGLSVPTRMALQMAVALALAFVVGFTAFASHWGWTVLTAFIVCSGARGRGDAVYKGALRLLGATAGTLAATSLTYFAAPSGAAEAVLIFVVLFFGIWLRERSYAYWAAAMTLVLALLARSGGPATFALLAVRLEAILIGALCAVVAAWFVYPIRTRDVVRRRLADALVALDGVLTREPRGDDGGSELAVFESRMTELESVAFPLRWHRRIFAAADVAEHPVRWIDIAHDVKLHARTFMPNHARDARRRGAVRRAIGESRRAIGRHGKAEVEPEGPSISVALLHLRDLLISAGDSQDGGASIAKRRRMELEAYLHFDGTCEEALTFYKEVFAGEVVSLMRFGDMKGADAPAGYADRVMHASFKSNDLKFMASDLPPGTGQFTGAQVSLSLSTRDPIEGERLFAMLGAGGEVTMPMHDTFWGARFGTLTDRFGIAWMVNAEKS
jgi:uncharacterized glyoxalase superfamily protein PhnB